MDTCPNCGEEIQFRMIDGRCVRLRCKCASWTGSREVAPLVRREYASPPSKNFTHPTKCPKCREDVFYIEHNGGSVWVDDLGWPWPKHGCFDDDPATSHFAAWSTNASTFTGRELGVVISMLPDGRQVEPVLELQMSDSSRLILILLSTPPREVILNALVVVSIRDKLMLHPAYGTITFHSADRIATAEYSQVDELSLDDEIQAAAERVARKAWKGVSSEWSNNDRLHLAKLEVLHIVKGFPSPFREKLEHYFTSRKWEPLFARMPKN